MVSIVARYSILKGCHPSEKNFTFGHFPELAVESFNGIFGINQMYYRFRIFEISRQCCPVIMIGFIDFKPFMIESQKIALSYSPTYMPRTSFFPFISIPMTM